MLNTNIAFVVTDLKNNIAIISGFNDYEDSWYLCNGEYIHKNIDSISLEIDDNHYKYKILCKDPLRIRIKTADLMEDISEAVDINSIIDELIHYDIVNIIENSDNTRKIEFNLLGTDIVLCESTIRLMRGIHKYLYIEL